MTFKRPRVRISFKYNRDTGEIEEFIVDDQARTASEAYHDAVASSVASLLARHPEIEDAGLVDLAAVEPQVTTPPVPTPVPTPTTEPEA